MAIKKQVYINAELEWAEEKLAEWKLYVDNNPFATMTHDIQYKETKGGGTMPMVVASRESKIKCVRDTMKEYFAMLEVVNKLRTSEEAKKRVARGGHEVPEAMEDEG